jgi:hypothetical protein
MKKVTFIMIMLMTIMSCGSKFGEGGDNAAQYVREQMPELANDAVSVEVVNTDTVNVYDISTLTKELEMKEIDADLKNITFKELREFADSIDKMSEPRLMYVVEITAKSSKKTEVKVIMEKDGTTPYMLYDKYLEIYQPFLERLLNDEVVIGESDIEEVL